ncbi:sulfatase family protein [Rhodopirellula bahusiensis]|uniref:Arylsulfatase n=1 Tax=Rhodopirellula bahusiensis TaxID=2014065 RepID=A0A2G1WD38_9BACT|nr:arylsulfatase [Rhodopirellula bahusiensis]PHQ36954.1 arylsulfatase [Rhodopirellula bahusiensis]
MRCPSLLRSPFARFLLVSLGCILNVSPLCAETKTQPNVLILYADDLGYGDLNLQNAESKIPTPHLDQLARSGMRFTDGHSSSGICTPSRYALLTGRHHWRDFHGIVNAFGQSVFEPEQLTLAEMFQQHGYETAAIGKWHLGWDWDAVKKPDAKTFGEGRKKGYGPEAFDWTKPIPDGPLAHGFDSYFGDTVINFPPYCWIENDKVVKAPDTIMDTAKWKPIKEGNWECRPGPMTSDWDPYENIPTTTERGVQFIQSKSDSDQPFFLYFAFPAPHAPIIPNDEFDGRSGAGPYGDYVCETDDACGKLLQALKDSGQSDNTLVVFSADNGPERYAYARDEKYDHWSSQPFRGLKRDLYEGGHHVPFVIHWPGVTDAESTCDALVSQVDLFATMADMLGHEIPDGQAKDSRSLMPLLKQPNQKHRQSLVQNTRVDEYAIRDGKWLLIDAKSGYVSGRNKGWESRRQIPADDKQPYELYDLSVDIGQSENVASEYPETVERMKSLLQTIREDGYPE